MKFVDQEVMEDMKIQIGQDELLKVSNPLLPQPLVLE